MREKETEMMESEIDDWLKDQQAGDDQIVEDKLTTSEDYFKNIV